MRISIRMNSDNGPWSRLVIAVVGIYPKKDVASRIIKYI